MNINVGVSRYKQAASNMGVSSLDRLTFRDYKICVLKKTVQ